MCKRHSAPARKTAKNTPKILGVVLLRILYYNEVLICFITTILRYSANRYPTKKGSLFMVKVLTDQGEIGISNAVFTTITGAAATNCFGVKGMAYRSMTDGIVHLLTPENLWMTISEDCYIETVGGVRIYPVAQLIDNGTYKLSTAKLSVTPDEFKKILESRDRTKAGITAPPTGLFLWEVKFDGIRRHV